MSVIMDQRGPSVNPLSHVSEGDSLSSSPSESPTSKQRTQTFRAITHTPPARCSTLGPESLTPPVRSSSHVDSNEEDEEGEEVEEKNASVDGSSTSDNDNDSNDGTGNGNQTPLDPAGTSTLPSLADEGASLSCSIISSHEASFCNSLLVSQGEAVEVERMPSMDPHHTVARPRAGDVAAAEPPLPPRTARDDATSEESGGGGGNDDGGTPAAVVPTAPVRPSSPRKELSIQLPSEPGGSPRTTSSRAGSQPTSSPTAATGPGRQHPATPGSDIRTLRELMHWRSHLSDSQRSTDTHDGGAAQSGHESGTPFSKSVPAQPMQVSMSRGGGRSPFPVSLPVTPALWSPTPVVRRNDVAVPPPLFDSAAASALSATAAPASRHPSRDDVASHGSGASPFSARPPGLPPRRVSSAYLSKSELGDSFTSSATSHLTSPAVAAPPHRAISTPYDSRPHIDCDGGSNGSGGGAFPHSNVSSPILTTPTTMHRARHSEPNLPADVHSSHNGIANLHGSGSGGGGSADGHGSPQTPSKLCAGASPASSPPSVGTPWGIEDHAPAHSRSVGFSHLPALSPTAHHRANRGSESTAASPRGGLAGLYPSSVSQDAVHGSPILLSPGVRGVGMEVGLSGGGDSSSQASRSGTMAHLHRATSSVLSTPCGSSTTTTTRAARDPAKMWRGLKAPEEYPGFATPVDDDTNKAVVGFVTALLLVLLLFFIFAI